MVGYQQDDQMTTNQKLIAGGFSGVITRFVTQPLDVLKIKTQLQKKIGSAKSKSLFETSKSIYFEEGVSGFWHGHNLGQIHSVISTSSQFYVYELSTKYAFKIVDQKYKLFAEFVCGLLSGFCVSTVTTPIDVMRVRQILIKEQYRGFYNGAKTVYRSGGLLAFYEGWFTGVLMVGPQMGITFAMFSFIQPMILNYFYTSNGAFQYEKAKAHKPEHIIFASSLAAGVAGIMSKIVTYPLDLARKRLQIATHKSSDKYFTPSTSKHVIKCSKLKQCIVDSYKSDGIKGLYRGLKITLYKAQVTTIVTFTTYEMVCYFIRDVGRI